MNKTIVASTIAITTFFTFQPKAQAFFFSPLGTGTAAVKAAEGAAVIGLGGLAMGKEANISNFGYLLIGFLLLLDNPAESTSHLAQNIQAYGASPDESKNLAALFVNAKLAENSTHTPVEITDDSLKEAAPQFSQSANFGVFLRDINNTQK